VITATFLLPSSATDAWTVASKVHLDFDPANAGACWGMIAMRCLLNLLDLLRSRSDLLMMCYFTVCHTCRYNRRLP
jgi:hypothetical protein